MVVPYQVVCLSVGAVVVVLAMVLVWLWALRCVLLHGIWRGSVLSRQFDVLN